MRVYIQQTSQKNIMKFICDEMLTTGSLELNPESDLSESPLAQHLFNFPFLEKVYITANFVALQKNETVEWEDVAQALKEEVNAFLQRGLILKKESEKKPYTLYAEMTPNPQVMKFVTNQRLSAKRIEVKSKEEAEKVPMALAIFNEFPLIEEVFISDNYLSLTAPKDTDWQIKALEIRQFLLAYLSKEESIIVCEDYVPVVRQEAPQLEKRTFSSVEKQIEAILAEYIQPAVANDGGNISLVEFDEKTKTAKMLLQGACSGCPSSTLTLKNGIASVLQEMLPGTVEHVEAVNG